MAKDCWAHGLCRGLIGQDDRDPSGQGADIAEAEIFARRRARSHYGKPQQHKGEMARRIGVWNPEHGSEHDQAYRGEEFAPNRSVFSQWGSRASQAACARQRDGAQEGPSSGHSRRRQE